MFGVRSIVRNVTLSNLNPLAQMNDQGTESRPTSMGPTMMSYCKIAWQTQMTQRTSKLNWQLSLETVWESLVPGFHRWFTKHRSEQFKNCLVLSARKNLGIAGRFYTNGLELKHRLQKKRLREDEIPEEVANVTSMLEKWTTEFYLEEERAVRGLGKYRLAPGYDQFQVDPVK